MNTRTFVFLSISFFLSSFISAQSTFYISKNGNGNGLAWDNATDKLHLILKKAKAGDQIWIAAGTYLPTSSNNRSASFEIPNGVALYGGFAGNETTLDQRNVTENETILSGAIGSEDDFDNSYNVVVFEQASAQTILDGLTIADGQANGSGVTGTRLRAGGGMFNNGESGSSSPTIRNCTFRNNFAKDGGAVYNNGRSGMANPTFENCVFENNTTDLDGGAVYNDGRINGQCNPAFAQCQFIGNKGNYGGAISNYGMDGEAEPIYTECVFSENQAYVKGGGIFHLSNKNVDKAQFATVLFNNNSSLDHASDEIYHYLVFSKQVAQR